jgi:hypothetical protein
MAYKMWTMRRQGEELTDFTLTCGESCKIPCQKSVLAANSKVFKDMFNLCSKDSSQQLRLDGITPSILELMVEAMYMDPPALRFRLLSKTSSKDTEKVELLQEASDKYQIPHVREACEWAMRQWCRLKKLDKYEDLN